MSEVVILTNIPSPYRVYFFNSLFKKNLKDFKVFYCATNEKNRSWTLPEICHPYCFMKTQRLGIALYWKSNVRYLLKKENPKIVVICGFNPVMLSAWLFCIFHNKRRVIWTDSWIVPVNQLSLIHKFVRRVVFRFSDRFICISQKGKEFLIKYGCKPEQIFISPIVIDDSKFYYSKKKTYDLMFSGQMVDYKSPIFFSELVVEVNKLRPNTTALIIGDGPLKDRMLNILDEVKIHYYYAGYLQQPELPKYYASAKLLIFPTKGEPWGVVTNEACAAGLPVLISEFAGAAGCLVNDNNNGYVLPLVIEKWTPKVIDLLNNTSLYSAFSNASLSKANDYSLNNALIGFILAIKSLQ